MFSVQCTTYSVQCTVYSVLCTVYSIQYTAYSVQCTVGLGGQPEEALEEDTSFSGNKLFLLRSLIEHCKHFAECNCDMSQIFPGIEIYTG